MTSAMGRGATTVVAEPGRAPLPLGRALVAEARCVVRTARLLAGRRVRQPSEHVGDVLHFADGSSARVYRETVLDHGPLTAPAALVVEFRLRWIRGRGHTWFRAESLLNTPLFVGFDGFVSKLWLAHDQNGAYRGVYQWDGAASAHAYARALWWILALVSERGSIRYVVVPDCTRDELVASEAPIDGSWWRVTKVPGSSPVRH